MPTSLVEPKSLSGFGSAAQRRQTPARMPGPSCGASSAATERPRTSSYWIVARGAAQMGPVNLTGRGRARRNVPKVIGYERRGDTVAYACPDRACEFRQSMPVYVIDDDIYEQRPALVIGTVDKFAMLAWHPEARSIFGLAADGSRLASPPSLIIQDELHLISGPLGSMVGLYEPVIEQLCTDARQEPPARPKIISSTATIRSYREQIRDLYARDEACLFPPPGLDADDSFFARCAPDTRWPARTGPHLRRCACSGVGVTANGPSASTDGVATGTATLRRI